MVFRVIIKVLTLKVVVMMLLLQPNMKTFVLDKQLKLLYHQLNIIMSRTLILNIFQKMFMIISRIDPFKVMISLWDTGNITRMNVPNFQNTIMNQEIKLSYMDQFRNLNCLMKFFIFQKIVDLTLINF